MFSELESHIKVLESGVSFCFFLDLCMASIFLRAYVAFSLSVFRERKYFIASPYKDMAPKRPGPKLYVFI